MTNSKYLSLILLKKLNKHSKNLDTKYN